MNWRMKSTHFHFDYILYALTILFGTVLFMPVVRWLLLEWMSNDYYSHGPLVPLVSLFFAWRARPNLEKEPDNRGLLLLGGGVILYLIAVYYRAFHIGALMMIVTLGGAIWTYWGKEGIRKLAFPLAFLIFMIPFPFVEASSLPLSLLTGQVATRLMQALGLDVSVQGAAVSLPNVNLVVGAQCSGVRSIISLFTLYAVFVHIVEGSWVRKLILFFSAIPAAIAGNILRVSSLLWVANRWGAEAGFKYYHDYSGFVFFFFVVIILLLIARLLKCDKIRSDL
jgi:exosortase